MIPPITTEAKGRCTSEPIPVFNAIGTKPNEATNAVVITGRRRVIAPSNIACSSGMFCLRKSRMNDTMTKPFNMAIPDNAINPTAAEIENGMSLNMSAAIPPVRAKGTPVNMIIASLNEPSASISSPRIKNKVTGTTMDKRCEADCNF